MSLPAYPMATGHCRKLWLARAAGSLWIVLYQEKNGRLHKSRCEIIFKVFPPLSRKNKAALADGDFSVGATAAEDTCVQQRAECTRDYSYRFYYEPPQA